MSTAARGTLGDGVRPASAMASRGLPRRRATSLGMAGRGRVQIRCSVRAAGQPRHRMPLPLLLLHAVAASSLRINEHQPATSSFLSNSTTLLVPWRRWLPPVPQGNWKEYGLLLYA